MDDEAEIYDGVRAQFPLSFGKQSKSQTPLEQIHSATRRSSATGAAASESSDSVKDPSEGFPSLSSSSKSWLDSVRSSSKPGPGAPPPPNPKIGPARPPQLQASSDFDREEDDQDRSAPVGPPPPPPGLIKDDNDDSEVIVGPPRPPSEAVIDDDDDDDGEMVGPPRPPAPVTDSDDDDEEEEEEENRHRIPTSNEIVLKGHTKIVSALAIDNSGSRVLSGSYDYTVRMYDFGGMNSSLQSFRQLEPSEGHQVRHLSWSPTADKFLCVTGSAQAKIYDRDGLTLGEFVKGDMYIRDLKNTKGHITGLTCGEWNPKAREKILTSSEDGSLRIWDVNDFKSQKQVIKPKLARPGRVPVTTCTWDREGKCIAGGVGDGSIQLWTLKPGWGSRPDVHVQNAHSEEITGLKFSSDGRILLSRSFDGSLKVWDMRKMKDALKEFEDLPNHYSQTNIALSPDEQLIVTGTSVERESTTGGLLCIFDRSKLELISKIGISPTCSVVQCAWHSKLNQIFATTGDKGQGGTHILYDPTLSERGALLCVARAPRKQSIDDFEIQPVIHNPHALPLFRDAPSRKRQREKMLKDPLKSHKPEVPMSGPGHGGRIGTSKGSLLTQYLMKQGGMLKETWMDEDPREAILKFADVAAKEPKFIAPAYADTQPETVFAKSDSEDDEK
ncbi:WD repeat-containing protein 70 [Linum perenne]